MAGVKFQVDVTSDDNFKKQNHWYGNLGYVDSNSLHVSKQVRSMLALCLWA